MLPCQVAHLLECFLSSYGTRSIQEVLSNSLLPDISALYITEVTYDVTEDLQRCFRLLHIS